jgi:3-(3-hydroxy-phenyl)propionate hydroxylase
MTDEDRSGGGRRCGHHRVTAATLLDQYGVECLILERRGPIYAQSRAVALDDEVHRILARLGLRDEFAAIIRSQGLRLVGPTMRVLAATAPRARPEGTGHRQPDAPLRRSGLVIRPRLRRTLAG